MRILEVREGMKGSEESVSRIGVENQERVVGGGTVVEVIEGGMGNSKGIGEDLWTLVCDGK